MFLNSLPTDVFLSVLNNLQLRDLPSLFLANKKTLDLLNVEHTYHIMARQKYPASTLILPVYENSWKLLLRDDNAKNGIYIRKVNVVSRCKYNSSSRFYIGSLREMMWDRKAKTIGLVIEAYGHSDLSSPARTSILRTKPVSVSSDGTSLWKEYVGTTIPFSDPLSRLVVTKLLTGGRSSSQHQLWQLTFDETSFRPGHSYKFMYNGKGTIRGSDYECVMFLNKNRFRSLPALFDTNQERCNFVSRGKPWPEPSDVLSSPVKLPQRIQRLHRQGRWGTKGDNEGGGRTRTRTRTRTTTTAMAAALSRVRTRTNGFASYRASATTNHTDVALTSVFSSR